MRTDQMEQMLRLIAMREHWPLPQKSLRRVVQKKLLAMVKASLVRRIVPPIFPHEGTGPPFYLYTLAKAGAALVAESLGMTVQELGWRPSGDESFLFLNHILALVGYRLILVEACVRQGVDLAGWVVDRRLRKRPARVMLTGDEGERIQVSVVPDAYYQLKLPSGHTLSCCVELDRGTSTVAPSQWQAKSWRRKMLAYQQLQAQGLADSEWATHGFIVTTVTTSALRMAHLKSVCEGVGGDHHFWFTTFAELSAGTILTAPVWFVAGQGEKRHRLLPERATREGAVLMAKP
jgi:hypothetical protein